MDKHTFAISNSVPFPRGPNDASVEIDLDNAETFMFDSKLAHVKNFQYLPPVNQDGTAYGVYQDFRSTTKESLADIYASLNIAKLPDTSYETVTNETVYDTVDDYKVLNRAPGLTFNQVTIPREFVQIHFTETSSENNILAQIFEEEKNTGSFIKLDIVDAGEFPYDESDPERPAKHVYYVGKILFDSNNIPTFVNIFTMFFD